MTSWTWTPVIPPGGPGDPLDEGVGHELPAGAGVPGGAEGPGVPGQGGVDGDALPGREQCGQVRHGLRCRAEADVPVGGGMGGPIRDRARVHPVRGGAGRGGDGPVPGAGERAGVRGKLGVHCVPARGGQARGFAHQERGTPFIQVPGGQRGQGAWHLRHQGLRQAQQPAAAGRGLPPRQGDLRRDALSQLRGGHPRGGLGPAFQGIEGHRDPGRQRGRGGLHILQLPELAD
jgi:hypothetical protein